MESEVEVGSTFRFTYQPLQNSEEETIQKEIAVTEERLRILLMDDEELICQAVANC